jgi:glycosyltransferase involved in cell wall biosynthesis
MAMAKTAPAMRICVIFDCMYPYTIGGVERWYDGLTRHLAREGHEVTYVTLRQWPRDRPPRLPERLRVTSVGAPMALYARGRRRILPALLFGAGVLAHLIRHGRDYDIVHVCSVPFFSLLAVAAARPAGRYRLLVDWYEVWSGEYWRSYLGPVGGRVGWLVQRLCARLPQRAFCSSRMHAGRLRAEGCRGPIVVSRGLRAGIGAATPAGEAEPLVVFAGRLIPEKRAPLAAEAFALAAARVEGLRAEFYGDGPDRAALLSAIARLGISEIALAPGFVEEARIDAAMRRALCMLSTSRREGYGLVVVEAAARGTPSIVVAGEDNAAMELIEDGVNGFLVRDDDALSIAEAIVRAHRCGMALRRGTAAWFARNAAELSLEGSLHAVLEGYGALGADREASA